MIVDVDSASRQVMFDGVIYPCRLGRHGVIDAASKREGDGRTPLGSWQVRGVMLRPDADYAPPPSLPWRWIRPLDGWCDDEASPSYNSLVTHPLAASAERLWRDDHAYDVIVVLGYNDAPPITGLGSAIFMHLQTDAATEGCVAIDPKMMRRFLALVNSSFVVRIT